MIRLRPMRLCVHASMRRHVGITALDIALDGVHAHVHIHVRGDV